MAEYPSWEITQKEFDNLNIGPSLIERESQILGDLLCYHKVFAFILNQLGDS